MLKIIGILSSVFFGNYFSQRTPPPSVVLLEFAMSKSRILVFALIACITLSILFSGGIFIAIMGAAAWISAEPGEVTSHAELLVYAGATLMLLTTTAALTAFSKERFNFTMPVEKTSAQAPAVAATAPTETPMQQLMVAVAKELIKKPERTQEKETHLPTVRSAVPHSKKIAVHPHH